MTLSGLCKKRQIEEEKKSKSEYCKKLPNFFRASLTMSSVRNKGERKKIDETG
jgi:hypothetical protein